MTRYKKELIKHGLPLECSVPYMPWDNFGRSYVTVEAITTCIKGRYIEYAEHTNVLGWTYHYINERFVIVESISPEVQEDYERWE